MDVWQRLDDFLKGEPKVLEWGTTPLGPLPHAEHLKRWVHQGYHGKMKYMEENLDLRGDPRRYAPWAQSALLMALANPRPVNPNHPTAYKVSRYAQGEDYHRWGNRLLSRVTAYMQSLLPEARIEGFLDTRPVFERDLALEAGLGWQGKNCCTIHPKHGSNFFVTGLLMDFPARAPEPVTDFCGSCRACLDACPTDAFEGPGVLNSNKCISYWTIENKEDLPEDLSQQFQGWIFGCDICQEVCPWNRKALKRVSGGDGSKQTSPAGKGPQVLSSESKTFRQIREASLRETGSSVDGFGGRTQHSPGEPHCEENRLPPTNRALTHESEVPSGVTEMGNGPGTDGDRIPENGIERDTSASTPFELSGLEWLGRLRKGGGFQKYYKHTPLMRAGRKRLLRNLAAAAGAAGDVSVKEMLREILKEEEDPHVRGQIRKALEEL